MFKFNRILGAIFLAFLMSLTAIFTITKFSELYVPKEKRFYPRLDKLEPIRLKEPSNGMLPPIVRLHDSDGNFFCTGTVVASNTVLTAAHCVLEPGGLRKDVIYVKSIDKLTTVEAKAASAYSRLDVAIIQGNFQDFKYASVLTSPVSVLSEQGPFITCGFPGGGSVFCPVFFPETIYNFGILGRGVFYPGMSGGSVVILPSQQIIGVISYVEGTKAVIGPTIELWSYLGVEVID